MEWCRDGVPVRERLEPLTFVPALLPLLLPVAMVARSLTAAILVTCCFELARSRISREDPADVGALGGRVECPCKLWLPAAPPLGIQGDVSLVFRGEELEARDEVRREVPVGVSALGPRGLLFRTPLPLGLNLGLVLPC